MKNLPCLLILILFTVVASAQKVHFVYFETDNAQPFYLKLDDKVYTSSSTGSFVLPNLTDSTYDLSIGFPATNTESKFKLPVSGKDYGYAIKTFDFGLGLFDLQSLSVTRPQADKWKNSVTYEYRKNDFTSLLAKASNDTSLFYIPVIVKEEVTVQQPETKKEEVIPGPDTLNKGNAVSLAGGTAGTASVLVVKPVEKSETQPFVFPGALIPADTISNKQASTDVTDSLPATAVITDSPSKNSTGVGESAVVVLATDSVGTLKADSIAVQPEIIEEYRKSTVKRHAESSTSEGFGLVFFDMIEGGGDTIKLIIPNPQVVFKEADTTQFEDGLLEIKKDNQAVLAPAGDLKKTAPKSNCALAASDNDFFKLRKNMAAKETDEDMINEAKKAFRNKCFSTGQIKNLSSLFLNDEGKYQFFDAAYTHVTDQQVFYGLQAELKDEYYLKRFKALIGE